MAAGSREASVIFDVEDVLAFLHPTDGAKRQGRAQWPGEPRMPWAAELQFSEDRGGDIG